MALSLKAFAARFGVAVSTVSRALSGDVGVNDELRRRIQDAAAVEGYRPRPMRRRVNDTIGIVLCSAPRGGGHVDSYHSIVFIEAMSCVNRSGWHLLTETLQPGLALPNLLEENRVDGLILCGHPSRALCDRIGETCIPALVLDDLSERTGLPSIMVDIGKSTCEVVRRLGSLGHRNIALVTPPGVFPTVAARIQGYRQGLAGIPGARPVIREVGGEGFISFGQEAAIALCQGPASERPTAIVFATDRLALGGLLGLSRVGLSVPEDISIVGHDAISLSQETSPAITTVDCDVSAMVALAFDRLRREICRRFSPSSVTEDRPMQLIVPSRILWRESCGPAPVRKPGAVEAI